MIQNHLMVRKHIAGILKANCTFLMLHLLPFIFHSSCDVKEWNPKQIHALHVWRYQVVQCGCSQLSQSICRQKGLGVKCVCLLELIDSRQFPLCSVPVGSLFCWRWRRGNLAETQWGKNILEWLYCHLVPGRLLTFLVFDVGKVKFYATEEDNEEKFVSSF